MWKNNAELPGDQMSCPKVDQIDTHWKKTETSVEVVSQKVFDANFHGKKHQKRSINVNRNPGILSREDKIQKQMPRQMQKEDRETANKQAAKGYCLEEKAVTGQSPNK